MKLVEYSKISLDIHEEVNLQSQLLHDMEMDMDKSDNLLNKTIKKLQIMMKQQSSSWMWVIILFLILTIIYLYSRF